MPGLITPEQLEVLKYITKVLNTPCPHCGLHHKLAVWDVRSDGKAGRVSCTSCDFYSGWHHLNPHVIA